MTTDEVTVRIARPADGARCNEFYNRYYGRQRTLRQWEWQFCERVFEDGTVPVAFAEHEGEIVGTQALMPIELVDAAGGYWSAKSEETLIASSMRGRGLLRRLYEPLLTIAHAHRFESIWGFTPASKAFEREGFSCPTRTAQLLRCFTPDALGSLLPTVPRQRLGRRFAARLGSRALTAYARLGSLLRRPAKPSGLELNMLSDAPDWADDLSQQFVRDWGGTTLHRTERYMRWRFFENPYRRPLVLSAHHGGRPIGWLAFGLGSGGTAAIVDIVARRSANGLSAAAVVAALVHEASQRAEAMGASAIRAWDVTGHPFAVLVRRAVQRLGWIHVRRGFDMVLKYTPGIEPRADSTPIERWYVTRAFNEGSDV